MLQIKKCKNRRVYTLFRDDINEEKDSDVEDEVENVEYKTEPEKT